jgi:hypothetical protein
VIVGALVKAAQKIEDEEKRLRPMWQARMRFVKLKLQSSLHTSDSHLGRAGFDLRTTLDRAETRARIGMAGAIGRTVMELEKIRREIVED